MKNMRRGLALTGGSLMLALTAFAGPAQATEAAPADVAPATQAASTATAGTAAQTAANFTGTLPSGQFIYSHNRLRSPNGQHELSFVTRSGSTRMALLGTCAYREFARYAPTTFGGDAKLTMQTDGNLVLRRGTVAVWSSRTAGNPGARLQMRDDRNLVIVAPSGRQVWTSNTPCNILHNRDLGGWGTTRTLKPGQYMTSSNGVYRLTMQTDGNLVLRNGNRAIWSTRTRQIGDSFSLQSNGNLTVGSSRYPSWQSGTGTNADRPSELRLQSDGNLILFRHDGIAWRAVWQSRTNGR